MAASLYVICFVDSTGAEQWSSVAQTIRVARNRAKWLASKDFAKEVIVWRGQPGGERVLTLHGAA